MKGKDIIAYGLAVLGTGLAAVIIFTYVMALL